MRRIPVDPVLAESIARRRRAVGWSQQRLAEAVGVTDAAICHWETRRQGVTPGLRDKVDAVLDEAVAAALEELRCCSAIKQGVS